MSTSPFATSRSARAALVAAFASLPALGFAQTLFQGATGAEWSDPASWSGGVAPNAVDAHVAFPAAVAVNLTGGPFTFGRLDTDIASGSLVLGSNSVTDDFLRAEVSAGAPVIHVANGGGTVFFYGGLEGTQGFEKTGAGKLTFRFNATAQAYSGSITITAGILGINQASSLGGATSVTIGNGARLLAEPGANSGVITLDSSRAFTLAGAQSQLGANNAAVELVIEGAVGETAAGNGLVKTDAGVVTLTGPLAYTGETRIAGGTLRLGGSALLPASQNLRFTGAALSTLDVGSTAQTVRTLVFDNNTQNRVFTGGGALTVNGDANLALGLTNGRAFDASGLGAFTFDRANRNVSFQTVNTDAVTTIADWLLAAAGGGTNTITANQLLIGGGNSVGNNGNTARLRLGGVNNFNLNNFILGAFNAGAVVNFQPGLTEPVLKLRGVDGVSAATLWRIGDTSSGARRGEANVDLSGGALDARVTTVVVNRHVAGANNAAISNLAMPAGELVADTLVLGEKINLGTPLLTTTFAQGGGTVRVGTLVAGRAVNTPSTEFPTPTQTGLVDLRSTYTLAGGTLHLGALQVGAAPFAATSTRTLALAGGTLTHLDATTDLVADGVAGEGGLLALAAATGTTSILEADTGRTILLGAHTALVAPDATAVLAKTGAGTLVLAGASTGFAGTWRLDAGTLALGDSNTLTTIQAGGFVWNAGTVAFDLSTADTQSDTLSVTGALAKGDGPVRTVDLKGAGAAGTYTLATFGSTDLVVGDLVAANVPAGLSASFTVGASSLTVTLASSGGAGGLAAWRTLKFGSAANTGDGADAADPDNDGRANLIEYASGTEPLAANAGAAVVLGQTGGKLTLTFDRIADPALTYTVRASNDLTTAWSAGAVVFTSTGGANTDGPVTVEDSVAISAQPRRFLRLEILY